MDRSLPDIICCAVLVIAGIVTYGLYLMQRGGK